MKRKRFTEEQTIGVLNEAEQSCKNLGIDRNRLVSPSVVQLRVLQKLAQRRQPFGAKFRMSSPARVMGSAIQRRAGRMRDSVD